MCNPKKRILRACAPSGSTILSISTEVRSLFSISLPLPPMSTNSSSSPLLSRFRGPFLLLMHFIYVLLEELGAVEALAATASFFFLQFLAFFSFLHLPSIKWRWSFAAFTEVSFDSGRRFMAISSPSPLSASAPRTDPPGRLITAFNLRELAVCLSARCSALRASPLTSLGFQGVAVCGVEEDVVSTSGGATFREASGKTSCILGVLGMPLELQ